MDHGWCGGKWAVARAVIPMARHNRCMNDLGKTLGLRRGGFPGWIGNDWPIIIFFSRPAYRLVAVTAFWQVRWCCSPVPRSLPDLVHPSC